MLLFLQPEYSKYAAWLTLALVLGLGAHSLRQAVVALLLKLYEIIVQKNALS